MSNANPWPSASATGLEQHDAISSGPDGASMRWKENLRDGTTVLIRPISEEDVELERRFIEQLSPQSSRFRFLGQIKNASPELLKQFTHLDHAREVAFVALIDDGGSQREIGVSRYSSRADGLSCECAVAVSDEWQNRGLGTLLMQHLIEVARRHHIEVMYSLDARDNQAMRELADHLGFERKQDPDDATQVLHTLDLKAATT
ncbi:MAG: GNAT family N-acetyltransferase [Rhodanobacteraceae bacterium]